MNQVIVGTEECTTQKIANIIRSSKEFHLLHEKWPSIARDLEANEVAVKKLKQNLLLDKDQLSDVVHEVVSVWVGTTGSGATLDKLVNALESSELASIAESLKNEFQLQNSQWDVPNYYISRTVIMRNVLDQDKLKSMLKTSKDIFVFSGTTLSKLSRTLESQIVENSTRIIDRVGIRTNCIILDYPTHFDKICELTKLAVHLIKADASNEKWSHVKSNGNLSEIRNLIDKRQTYLSEKELVESNKGHSICISESPGMGKSTLLQSIGKQLSTIHNKSILFATMNEMVSSFENNEDSDEIETVLKFTLENLFCKNLVQKHSFENKFSSDKQQIELLLDGLDEVASTKMSLAFDLLKYLSTIQSIRVWITTRPHLLHDLEDCLNVIGYNIMEFTYEDQVDFLMDFWLSGNEPLDELRLEQFAERCLVKLNSKMSRKDEGLAGIPLQCLLIGEVYEEQAREHAVAMEPNETWIIQINSLIELYKKLVEKQYNKYLGNSNDRKILTKTEINAQHTRLAFQLIFPECVEDLPPLFQEAITLDELLIVGLVEKSCTALEPKFIHRTIAEFFIAKFLADVICSERNSELSKYRNLFFSKVVSPCHRYTGTAKMDSSVVFVFKNKEICHFLDTLLVDQKLICQFDLELNWREVIQACVLQDFFNLFEVFQFLLCTTIESVFSNIFNKHFLLDAIRFSSLPFVKIILDSTPALFEDDKTKSKSLQLSIVYPNLQIFLYLLNVKNLRELVREPNEITKFLVHYCVEDSEFESTFNVEQKIEMLKTLLEINPDLLEQRWPEFNMTPILRLCVHPKMLIELILRNANILAKDSEGDTVLHRNPYLILFEDRLGNTLNVLVKQKKFKGETPIMTLILEQELNFEVLDKFKALKVNFNSNNKDGHSILALSIINRAKSETICKLIELGANVRWKKGCNGKTLLHYAAENGNVDAMVLLSKELKMNIFEKRGRLKSPMEYFLKWINKEFRCIHFSNEELNSIISLANEQNGYVPVEIKIVQLKQYVQYMDDIAVKCLINDENNLMEGYVYNKKCISIIVKMFIENFESEPGRNILKYLISSGIVNHVENTLRLPYSKDSQKTLLHKAVKYGNVNILRFLIDECKHDVTVTDSYGETPFHQFFQGFDLEKAKFLVNRGASVHIATADYRNDSLLHFAVKYGSVDAVEWCLNSGLDVNSKNKLGETPLHKIVYRDLDGFFNAITRSYREIFEHLCDNGGNIFEVDHQGWSLLHHFGDQLNPSETLLEYLLEKGLDINAVDFEGNTPLHIARRLRKDYPESEILLLKHGADPTIRNKKGKTPALSNTKTSTSFFCKY